MTSLTVVECYMCTSKQVRSVCGGGVSSSWGYSSVVEHSTADREVPGSNPGAPSPFYFFPAFHSVAMMTNIFYLSVRESEEIEHNGRQPAWPSSRAKPP